MKHIGSVLICHGIQHDPQRDKNDPRQSIIYLWHQLDEFGHIHCMSFCAACPEREPLGKQNSYSLIDYQNALNKVHQAFGVLPNYIYDNIPNINIIKCPACSVYHALMQYPFLVNQWNNCLAHMEAIPCFLDKELIDGDKTDGIQEWKLCQRKHVDALIGYSSHFHFPKIVPPNMHPSSLREIRSYLDCGQEIIKYINSLNNDLLGLDKIRRMRTRYFDTISQMKSYLDDDKGDEQQQSDKWRNVDDIADPPGSIGFWIKRDLIPALFVLGMPAEYKSIYDTGLPEGFWYRPASRGRRAEKIGRRASSLLNILEDTEKCENHILPYTKEIQEDGSILVDPWYLLSCYDAITLHTGLDFLAKTIDTDHYTEVYSKHFSILKKEAIDGTLYIPFGGDILLNLVSGSSEDNEKHDLVVLDVNEFFRYIIERSGIPLDEIPGAVISKHEKNKMLVMPQQARMVPPTVTGHIVNRDDPGSRKDDNGCKTLTLEQLATIAGEKAGWKKASKPTSETMRKLMEKMEVPIIKVRSNGRDRNAYPEYLAMPHIEQWAKENMPPLT